MLIHHLEPPLQHRQLHGPAARLALRQRRRLLPDHRGLRPRGSEWTSWSHDSIKGDSSALRPGLG